LGKRLRPEGIHDIPKLMLHKRERAYKETCPSAEMSTTWYVDL
jgi:hypothetical protein